MDKKSNIFIGVGNIANIHVNFCKAFQKNNLSCDNYVWSNDTNHFYNDDQSKKLFLFNTCPPPFLIFGKNIFHLLNKGIKIFHFIRLVFKYNVFFFVSPQSFDGKHITLSVLQRLKNRVFFIFTGCVERDIDFDKSDPDYICNNCLDAGLQKFCYCKNIEKKKARVQSMEKHSNSILAQPDISTFVINKKKLLWFYLADDYTPDADNLVKKFDDQIIKIVHLPSNWKVKQTQIISPVLKRLKSRNNVEIIVKEELWEREKILQTLEEAHILVNSLGTGYNFTAVEAMGRGCVVLNSHPHWFSQYVPEAPVIHITKETLEDTILHIIDNRELLKSYAEKSIDYYIKYHSLESVGAYYKQVLNLN